MQLLKTDRGPLAVSTPEATCFELLRYMHQSGHLNHIATVLDELAENINPNVLIEIADKYPSVIAQRMGYLFDHLGHEVISAKLATYVQFKKLAIYSPLRPGAVHNNDDHCEKWYLIINEKIEPDL